MVCLIFHSSVKIPSEAPFLTVLFSLLGKYLRQLSLWEHSFIPNTSRVSSWEHVPRFIDMLEGCFMNMYDTEHAQIHICKVLDSSIKFI